jgi:hypothetical protein
MLQHDFQTLARAASAVQAASFKSAWGKCAASEHNPMSDFLQPRFWIASIVPIIRELLH